MSREDDIRAILTAVKQIEGYDMPSELLNIEFSDSPSGIQCKIMGPDGVNWHALFTINRAHGYVEICIHPANAVKEAPIPSPVGRPAPGVETAAERDIEAEGSVAQPAGATSGRGVVKGKGQKRT